MPDISKVILNGVTQMDVTQDTVAPGNLLLNETATMSNGTRTVGTVDLSTYAPLNSPAFTGTPTAPTAAAGTDTMQIATTAFVQGELSAHGLDETGIEIPSTDNLDAYQITGWYYWKGAIPTNAPVNTSYCSMYVDHAYSNTKQTVYRAATGTNTPATEWVRYKYSTGTWTTWVESPQGLSVVSLYYNSSGITDVTSDVTVTLSDDMRNYKLIELYVTTSSSNSSGRRSHILVEPRTLTAAFWYPFTNDGMNFYGVRLGLANSSTFTQLRFVSTTAPALYLVQILGVR